MKKLLNKIKDKVLGSQHDQDYYNEYQDDYLEIDTGDLAQKKSPSKILVKPYVVQKFEDIQPILDALREGKTISLVNIRPIKDKDMVELKRAVNKLKKTCDAVGGDIAGFGEDWVVVTPSCAYVFRQELENV